jgi:hypothetical protein
MTQQHPITPPPELVQQWVNQFAGNQECMPEQIYIARAAAQWGADQELEACCEWLQDPDLNVDTYKLRAARRPKQSSLKEQSIALLDLIQGSKKTWQLEDLDVVRRALESIPDHTSEERYDVG